MPAVKTPTGGLQLSSYLPNHLGSGPPVHLVASSSSSCWLASSPPFLHRREFFKCTRGRARAEIHLAVSCRRRRAGTALLPFLSRLVSALWSFGWLFGLEAELLRGFESRGLTTDRRIFFAGPLCDLISRSAVLLLLFSSFFARRSVNRL